MAVNIHCERLRPLRHWELPLSEAVSPPGCSQVSRHQLLNGCPARCLVRAGVLVYRYAGNAASAGPGCAGLSGWQEDQTGRVSMISITSSKQDSIAVVRVSGRIDGVSASEFQDSCRGVVTDEVKYLVLDLGEVQYVSSMGLRSLVVIGKELQQRSGALRLARVTGPVAKVLKISGFHTLFACFDSVESAVTG